jgi:hypothetical protein
MILRIGRALLSLVTGFWLFSLSSAIAADHRDSPQVDNDVTTDITDIFAFRDPANPAMLVIALNTHPFSVPKEAPSYHYNSNALYRIRFHTNTTGVPTSQIDVVFTPFTTSQSFTAYFPHGIVVQGPVTLATVNPTPPTPLITNGPQGIMVYAGPREDPFVFDLIGFDRFVAGQTPNFTGNNTFAGFNVNSIVIEVPLSLVVGSAQQFGVWGVTYNMLNGSTAQLQQVDRMGNPVINTVLIPAALKDAFNSGLPQNDATNFGPTILKTLAGFNTPQANVAILASVALPDTLKFNVSQPDGFPNGRRIQDRPTDIELQLVTGNSAVTDGTAALQAAKVYLSTFPYLGPPCQPAAAGMTAPGDCAATASTDGPSAMGAGFAWPDVADMAKPMPSSAK